MIIEREIEAAIEPVLARDGFEVVDVEYARRGGAGVITVFIDREGGVDLDQCARVSEIIGPLLDTYDLVKGRYYLEISSPGIERRLRKPAHFQRHVGDEVRIQTRDPIESRRRFRGTLVVADDNACVVETEDGTQHRIPYDAIAKANLVVDITF